MNYENSDFNEILISGIINNILDTDNQYIKFSMISKKYITSEFKNVYVSLNISRELYNVFKDYFYKGHKVFIKGYLNSYIDKNKLVKNFITVIEMADNPKDILNGRKEPHLRYDPDGVRVWNGKRKESQESSLEEQSEIENLINEIIKERNECSMLEDN